MKSAIWRYQKAAFNWKINKYDNFDVKHFYMKDFKYAASTENNIQTSCTHHSDEQMFTFFHIAFKVVLYVLKEK